MHKCINYAFYAFYVFYVIYVHAFIIMHIMHNLALLCKCLHYYANTYIIMQIMNVPCKIVHNGQIKLIITDD